MIIMHQRSNGYKITSIACLHSKKFITLDTDLEELNLLFFMEMQTIFHPAI